MLTHLEIENYKSLRKVSIDLPPFAVFVGANAAGKSNLVDAIDFLALAVQGGIRAALDEKGGYENICFKRERRARAPIRLRFVVENLVLPVSKKKYEFRFDCGFAFKARERTISSEIDVLEEKGIVSLREVASDISSEWQPLIQYDRFSGAPITVHEIDDKGLRAFLTPASVFQELFAKDVARDHRNDLLFLTSYQFLPPFLLASGYFRSVRTFRVNPASARKPASASGTGEMGKDGDNLPAALNYLGRQDPGLYQQLLEQVQLAVPSVDALETDYVETREVGLFLKEKGMGRRLYASELSDGTLRTLALFVPLIDPRYLLVVIEEPENCIHPWVVRQYVNACRTLSASKQIILTTHSPVLADGLRPDELFIVERENSETSVSKLPEREPSAEQIVSEGIMNLGAYWDSGAVGGVPGQLELFHAEER